MRLAVATNATTLPASVADHDHEQAAEVALQWQEYATHAHLWEMTATLRGADEGRASELAGLMASTGEQLALALSAAVEVALWVEHRATASPDETHEMAMRGMAEAQCHFVVGTGHALANVAVRALALDKTLLVQLAERLKRKDAKPFAPFSENRADWVSFSDGPCKALSAVAESCEQDQVDELIRPITDVGLGRVWRDLCNRRGKDFHRWRPQSHGLQGLAQTTPWSRAQGSRSLPLTPPPYRAARGRAHDTAGIATDAMLQLATAMRTFADNFAAASNVLGGPTLTRLSDTPRQ
ncbi:MAG: hypothetical protein WBC33_10265 [Conexibacter sp.]